MAISNREAVIREFRLLPWLATVPTTVRGRLAPVSQASPGGGLKGVEKAAISRSRFRDGVSVAAFQQDDGTARGLVHAPKGKGQGHALVLNDKR